MAGAKIMVSEKKILIVEDEAIEAMEIKDRLECLGYAVPAVASSGEEAIKKTEETQPDLVLMDIKLKGKMDGIEAAKKIRDRFNIPVVYLTAYGDEKTLQRAKITEPYGFILKPFEERELRTSIEISLYKHKMETEMRIKDKAIDSSINAVAIADLEGNISYVNRSFLKMWGYDNDNQVLGCPVVKFWQMKGKTVEIFDTVMNRGGWMGELVAERDDGSLFDVQLSASIVADDAGNPIYMMTSFVDITNRKKAEEEIIRVKEHLQNIVNSASEVIISFDMNNRVTTWNKTAEFVTGYKRREVIGRSIAKLKVFENSNELLDNLKRILDGEYVADEFILKTKRGSKRIIRPSYSIIKGVNIESMGVLSVGKDITLDREVHGKLTGGNSYLIQDKNIDSALTLFMHLTSSGKNGLLITRANPENMGGVAPSINVQVALLSEDKFDGFENISDLDGLITKISDFCKKNADSLILLGGIHYLLIRFSFEQFAKFFLQINDIVSKTNSILLLNLDPLILDTKQMAIIEKELQLLPSKDVGEIKIDDDARDLLIFIYNQNQSNSLVSFKKIMNEFDCVYLTAAKKIQTLENDQLIYTKNIGKAKRVYISEKGKTLLNKIQAI